MRALPAILALLLLPALLPPAEAAPPQAMTLNGQPSADVKGPVRAVSVDGPGRWAAVAAGDDPAAVASQDLDLTLYNLLSQSKGWEAADLDLLSEGAKLAVIANGTQGSEGQWLAVVNGSASPTTNLVSIYQANGFGPGGNPGRAFWQFDPTGPVNDLAISGRGDILGIATGTAAQNKSIILLRNRFTLQEPKVMFRASPTNTEYTDVVQFNTVALSHNSTVPGTATSQAAAYMVVGAQTTTTNGVGGAVYLFEVTFAAGPDSPSTQLVQRFDTSSPVTVAEMTADGEYAVVGTQSGAVYLVTVSEALRRRGPANVQEDLLPWQQSLGSAIRAVDIADFEGEFFAAATEGGDVVLFRNERDAAGSAGARGVQVGSANVNTPGCGNTRLSGPVASMAFSDFGDDLVVGAQNGLMSFEAAAHVRHLRRGVDPFEPAWCVGFAAGDVKDGVLADVSGDGRRVFAGTGHRVFGYNQFYCLRMDAEGGPARGGAPGQRVQWSVTVRNEGSRFDRVNLSVAGPIEPGWQFALSNSSLALMPGRSQTVLLNVTSPQSVPPGNFSLQLLAEAARQKGAPADAKCQGNTLQTPLRLDLGQLRRVEIEPPQGVLVASAGSPNTFPITILNGGNAADRFRVTARIPEPEENFKTPGSDWLLRVDPIEIEVPANGRGTVNLVVTPQRANRGDSAVVELTVEPAVPNPDGTFIGDTKQVTVAVEPSYNGDVALAETREYAAEPGQTIFINYTVKNLGNSRDIFVVENRTEPSNAPGFRLVLSDERFELRTQNQQKVVRLSLTVQQGVQPGESVRVVVDLFSEGLQAENPGSDGQVDSQSVTVNVVPRARRAPFMAEPLLALAVVATALLARRRGD